MTLCVVIPDLLDEAYEQLHTKGPEFEGWLSNHGPMAADALMRLGRGEDVAGWVRGYASRLEPMPEARWPISETEWPGLLGDASRLGDWCALLTQQVRDGPPCRARRLLAGVDRRHRSPVAVSSGQVVPVADPQTRRRSGNSDVDHAGV